MTINKLSKLVCRVECGQRKGTAFLISPKLALTAYHVVVEYSDSEINLYFTNEDIQRVAKIKEHSDDRYNKLDIALLELTEEIKRDAFLEFIDKDINSTDSWLSRGYPKSKQATGNNLTQKITSFSKG